MVDYRNAFSVEEKLVHFLNQDKRMQKYKLKLHPTDKYGIDVVATATGYEEFAIEIETTEAGKWPADAPYPITWKNGFTVPARKKKFFDRHPMGLYVKVNHNMTRAVVVPLSYVFSSHLQEKMRNSAEKSFTNNDFYRINDSEHPALCFCRMEALPSVVDAHFKHMIQLKRANAKYTDMRPHFVGNIKKEK